MQQQLRVTIAGMVQGVGFRYATRRKADSLGLTGWVRNTAKGEVEAVFEGEQDVLDKILGWCRQGPALSRVDHVTSEWSEAGGDFERFEIAL